MPRTFTCHRHKLKPGSRVAVERWLLHVRSRIDELRATLGPKGIDLEIVLLEEAADGGYPIFIIESDDYDRAVSVFAQSTRDIEVFHRHPLEENVFDLKRKE